MNPDKLADLRDRLLREQNLPLGVMAGLAAAVLGAIVLPWSLVTSWLSC